MHIGKSIKTIRRQLNITQVELANRCNLSQTSLSQIETGIKRPSQKTILKLCEVMDVPESMIYILAMQETDVPSSKKEIYQLLFPSIRNMALQIVSERAPIEHEAVA